MKPIGTRSGPMRSSREILRGQRSPMRRHQLHRGTQADAFESGAQCGKPHPRRRAPQLGKTKHSQWGDQSRRLERSREAVANRTDTSRNLPLMNSSAPPGSPLLSTSSAPLWLLEPPLPPASPPPPALLEPPPLAPSPPPLPAAGLGTAQPAMSVKRLGAPAAK